MKIRDVVRHRNPALWLTIPGATAKTPGQGLFAKEARILMIDGGELLVQRDDGAVTSVKIRDVVVCRKG